MSDDIGRDKLENFKFNLDDAELVELVKVGRVKNYLDRDDGSSGFCFDYLFDILKKSRNLQSRSTALDVILGEVRRRNTRVAMPEEIVQKLSDSEKVKLDDFQQRILRLSERAGIQKFPNG